MVVVLGTRRVRRDFERIQIGGSPISTFEIAPSAANTPASTNHNTILRVGVIYFVLFSNRWLMLAIDEQTFKLS